MPNKLSPNPPGPDAPAAAAPPHEGLADGPRRAALLTLLLAAVMAVLDGSIANVALPTIARELHASPAASIWVINGFQIAVCSTLFAFASLGQLLGYDRVWKVGLVLFIVASLGCATAHSLNVLVASRILQGIGGSMIMAIQPSILRHIYPTRMLGRGTGWFALTVASTSAAGPTVGGAILAIAPWPWLFLINLPAGIAIQIISRKTVPHFEATGKLAEFDYLGAGLAGLALAAFTLAVEAAAHGEMWQVGIFATITLTSLPLFIWRERTFARPLLPLDVFKRPTFALSSLTSICSYTGQGLGIVSLPFFFQTVLGKTPVEAGLLLTPWPVTVAVIAPLAGRLADRYPVWILGTFGLTVMAVGAASLAMMPHNPTAFDIVWRESITGLGFGFFQSPNNRELISSVPRNRSSVAGGMLATARLFGQSLGAAIVALIFGVLGARAIAAGGGENLSAIARAFPAAMWTACAIALCGAIISSTRRGLPMRAHD